MAREEKENGKFRKRPFRRRIALITNSTHSLFSCLFHKRLPPPPSRSSEMEQEVSDNHQEVVSVANDSSGKQRGVVGESGVQIICSDGGGLTELEKLIKQKTFTRSEVDHLTALICSRTVDAPVTEEEKRTEMVPSESKLPCGQKEEYPKKPTLENRTKTCLALTPHVTSSALRSMEMVDLSKLLDNIKGNQSDGALGHLSASAQNQKLTSKSDKVENDPLKLVAPSNELVPVITTTDAMNLRSQVLSSTKSVDSSYPPQKKMAFHMSANEDSLDLDDEAYPNGAMSSVSHVEKETTSSTAMAEKISSGTEAIAQENPSTLSGVMPSKSFTTDGAAHVKTADGPTFGEKVDVSTTSSISDPTSKPAMAARQTSFGSDRPASPNGLIANPPLFDFGNKAVLSTELTATGAPSKETTKSGPIFGLEKLVSSKEPGADAPLVNFGTKKVDKVSPIPLTVSTSVDSESTFMKFGASSDSKPGYSMSVAWEK